MLRRLRTFGKSHNESAARNVQREGTAYCLAKEILLAQVHRIYKRAGKGPLPPDGDEFDSIDIRPDPVTAEPELIARIVAALEYAFSELEPLTLIFLRLVYLEGVSQSDVAAVFNCNDSTVSRRLDQGLAALRRSAESFQQRDPASTEIEWSDLLVICQTPPDFIYEN